MPLDDTTRRDFLHLPDLRELASKLADAAAELPQEMTERIQFGESSEEKRLTQEALMEHLGITPEQAELHFTFGNHVLTPATSAIIDRLSINMVVGELRGARAFGPESSSRGLPSFKEYMNYLGGKGALGHELRYHDRRLRELIQAGIPVVTLDGLPSDSKPFSHDPEKSIDLSWLFAVLAVKGAGSLMKNGFGRRTLLKGALYIAAIASKPFLGQLQSGRIKPLEPLLDAQARLDTQSQEDGLFAGYAEQLIPVRNHVMAQNCWHVLGQVVSAGSEKQNILFMAGGAHGRAQDIFRAGPRASEAVLRGYLKELFGPTFDMLIETHGEDDSAMRISLFEISQLFSSPYDFRKGPQPESCIDPQNRPPDTCTLFLDEAYHAYCALGAEDQRKRELLWQLINDVRDLNLRKTAEYEKSLQNDFGKKTDSRSALPIDIDTTRAYFVPSEPDMSGYYPTLGRSIDGKDVDLKMVIYFDPAEDTFAVIKQSQEKDNAAFYDYKPMAAANLPIGKQPILWATHQTGKIEFSDMQVGNNCPWGEISSNCFVFQTVAKGAALPAKYLVVRPVP